MHSSGNTSTATPSFAARAIRLSTCSALYAQSATRILGTAAATRMKPCWIMQQSLGQIVAVPAARCRRACTTRFKLTHHLLCSGSALVAHFAADDHRMCSPAHLHAGKRRIPALGAEL